MQHHQHQLYINRCESFWQCSHERFKPYVDPGYKPLNDYDIDVEGGRQLVRRASLVSQRSQHRPRPHPSLSVSSSLDPAVAATTAHPASPV